MMGRLYRYYRSPRTDLKCASFAALQRGDLMANAGLADAVC